MSVEESESQDRPDAAKESASRGRDAPAAPPAGGSMVGTSFGRYQILEELGGGGMGVVYRAHDTRLNRTVALKFLPQYLSQDSESRSRFFAEARAASALDHVNVCTVYEIGETETGQIFIAMSAYDGETLKKKIARGPLPLDVAMDYTVQTARGLAKAHAKGIIHRDIKPANVMVTTDGVVKILDFGTAKTHDVALTQTGASIGTAGYMSPEQAEGEQVDARTDLWSLGVVLYEMLASEQPFKGARAVAVVYSVLCEEPPPVRELNSEVTPELADVIARCLAKDRQDRYSSAKELIADLEAVAARTGAQIRAAPPSTSVHSASTLGSWWTRTRVAALGVLAILALAIPWQLGWWDAGAAVTPGPDRRYVALLPLSASDPRDEVMAAGLTESLTAQLARLNGANDSLWVVPSSEIRGQGVVDVSGAWQAFRTTTVLTGTLMRQGSVTTLILNRVETGAAGSRLVDSETLPSPSSSAFVVASERSLVALLGFARPDGDPESVRGLTNPTAYPFYVQGLGYLSRVYDVEDLGAARNLFSQAIDADPNFASAYAGLCEATWELYEWVDDVSLAQEAATNCDRAAQLASDEASVLIPLAATYLQTGKHREAVSTLERALSLEPENAEAHRHLGEVYADLGRVEEAEASFGRAIDLRPDFWVNYVDFGIMLAYQGRLIEAGGLFEQVRRLAPDNHLADIYLAFTKLEQNEVAEAERLYRRSIRKKPDVIAYRNLGHLFFREREYGRAIAELQLGLELDDSDWWTWRWLGHAHHWRGEEAQSRAAWERVITIAEPILEVNPRGVDVLGGLAEAHIALGRVAEGRGYLDRLTALPEKWNYVTYYTGRIYEMLGSRETALTYVESALENHFDPITVERDPWLDDLRRDTRYAAMLESLNAVN